jgi:hypothetical protein
LIGVRAKPRRKNVEIANIAEAIPDPFELTTDSVDPVFVEERSQSAKSRAKTAHGHAHLVDCVRVGPLPNAGLGAIDLDELSLESAGEELFRSGSSTRHGYRIAGSLVAQTRFGVREDRAGGFASAGVLGRKTTVGTLDIG